MSSITPVRKLSTDQGEEPPAGKVDLEIENPHIAMGETLNGRVIITALKPLSGDIDVSIELTLQAAVCRLAGGSTDSGVITRREWENIASAAPVPVLIQSTGCLEAGESCFSTFSAVAPVHQQTAEAKNDFVNRWTTRDRDKIEGQSADELMRKWALRWIVNAEAPSLRARASRVIDTTISDAEFVRIRKQHRLIWIFTLVPTLMVVVPLMVVAPLAYWLPLPIILVAGLRAIARNIFKDGAKVGTRRYKNQKDSLINGNHSHPTDRREQRS